MEPTRLAYKFTKQASIVNILNQKVKAYMFVTVLLY